MELNADIGIILRKCILFSGLNDEEISSIESISEVRSISKGQLLFSEGDPANYMFIVISGKMRIYKLSSSGREQTLMNPGPGSAIAEAALFSGGEYPAYAEADENSELIFIEKRKILSLIESNPRIAINMIALLSDRLKKFTRKIEQLSLMGVVPRLAEYIMEQSKGENVFSLNISKGELSSVLGTVPETLSRAFGKLKMAGYIAENGKKIQILNAVGLKELASSYE